MGLACSTSVRCGSSFDQALRDISAMGFRHVDILTIDGWVHVNTSDMARQLEQSIAETEKLLAAYGVKPIAVNSGVSPQLHDRSPEACERRISETEALVAFMRHFGIGIAAIQPRQPDRSRPWDDVLADCVATLREQKAIGDAAGVKFALELHVNSPFETMEEARRLVEAMPDMPLVYDPTHFVMQGVDIRDTGWLMERAAHVHLRDAAPGKMQTAFGEGTVDFDWVLGELKRRGFSGHISIEYLESAELDVLKEVPKLKACIENVFPH